MPHAAFCYLISVLMGIDKVFLFVVVDAISIYAPLTGCDHRFRLRGRCRSNFNPHTPCRGATVYAVDLALDVSISIHTPLAGCDAYSVPSPLPLFISIHAPLAGCDLAVLRPAARGGQISIHAPLAGCDQKRRLRSVMVVISIHAPLAGCDNRCERRENC